MSTMGMSTMGLSSEAGIPKAHPDDGGLVVHCHHVALLLVDEALEVLQQRENRASIRLQSFYKDVSDRPRGGQSFCFASASTLYLSGTGCSAD